MISREVGGYISARQVVASRHAVYGIAGYQKVLEGSKVLPGYGYGAPSGDGTPPAFSSATLASNGPGLVHNGTVRLGYEFKPTPKLAFMLEGLPFPVALPPAAGGRGADGAGAHVAGPRGGRAARASSPSVHQAGDEPEAPARQCSASTTKCSLMWRSSEACETRKS